MIPLRVLAFTHKSTPLTELNRFFIPEEERSSRLANLKENLGLEELLYIATCNRIEFVWSSAEKCDDSFLRSFFTVLQPTWNEQDISFAIRHAMVYQGSQALDHLFRVASSLDSLVVGEREIITQVRKSYDQAKADGLTGDLIRLVVQATINAAKRVYTETRIAANPVSIVSLAERKLRALHLPKDTRILVVGAGETNTNLCKYLLKQGHTRFVVFNRTLNNAEALASMLRSTSVVAEAHPLSALASYTGGFDVLVTCTGSADPVITPAVYSKILCGETDKKVLVDLAMPTDIDSSIPADYAVEHIAIEDLRSIAEKNLFERQDELKHAERILEEQIQLFAQTYRTRSLELRMREVPDKMREIRDRAINEVFARDLESLDPRSRDVLSKVIDYMEKKYISVPMVMAKEILLDNR